MINICIVGATGLVGKMFLKILEEKKFPINKLKLLASKKSLGKIAIYDNKEYIIEELTEDSFDGFDLALFSAGGKISEKYVPIAISKGLVVIDNSSFFRMDEDVPLVIPQINYDSIKGKKLITNPNCSTIQSALPLSIINENYKIKKIIYNTYQAVSGSGQKGIEDLNNTKKGFEPSFYKYDISNTCIPQIDVFLENGFTKEEVKMIAETKKILNNNDILITATCVRVPVLNSHAVSIVCQLEETFDIEEIKRLFSQKEGIIVLDDIKNDIYPTSIISTGTDFVYVGRIRKDIDDPNTLLFYTTSDNIRKGAATNAVEIAVRLLADEKLINSKAFLN